MKEGEFIDDKSTQLKDVGSVSPISLARKKFSGRYAVSSEEFTGEMVRFQKFTVNLGIYSCLSLCMCLSTHQNAPGVSVYMYTFLIQVSFRITWIRLCFPRLELNLVISLI